MSPVSKTPFVNKQYNWPEPIDNLYSNHPITGRYSFEGYDY